MSKDATFNSANQPFNEQGARRLYSKQDAPQDFIASRRRKTSKDASVVKVPKKRGRPRVSKQRNVKNIKSSTISRTRNLKATEVSYLTNAKELQKNYKTNSRTNNCSECNDCQSNCCDKYPMRRIENVVFITCLAFTVVVTLFVQDHNFLSDLKKKIDIAKSSDVLQNNSQTNEITTNKNENSNTKKVEKDIEKTSEVLDSNTLEESNNKISTNYQNLYIVQQLPEPLLITVICQPEKEPQTEEIDILITMCEPSCCDCLSGSYAGGIANIAISDSIIVEGDLILEGCGGGGISSIFGQGINIGSKPVYTSPIDWGTPPLQSKYNFSSGSLSISESYSNNWSQTCVPPAPHNLSIFLLAGVMNSYFRIRSTV